MLYRRWLIEGDSALEAISSEAIAAAIETSAGRVECHVLPFAYRHLSPLVGSARRSPMGADEGEHGPTPPWPPVGSSIAHSDSSANTVGITSA